MAEILLQIHDADLVERLLTLAQRENITVEDLLTRLVQATLGASVSTTPANS